LDVTGEFIVDAGVVGGVAAVGEDGEPQPATIATRTPAESMTPESKYVIESHNATPCSHERSIASKHFSNRKVRSHRRRSVCARAANAISQTDFYWDGQVNGKMPAAGPNGATAMHRDLSSGSLPMSHLD
jgi:hypothetical protein